MNNILQDYINVLFLLKIFSQSFYCPSVNLGTCQLLPLCFNVCVCVCACTLSHIWLFVTPWTEACQAPLSMDFSRKEYWSGLLFPSPGDLPDPGIKLVSPMSPPSAGGLFTSWAIRGSLWCFNSDFLFFLFLFHFIILCKDEFITFPHLFTYVGIYIHMDLWTLSFFVVY